jgi:hypothetical protein
VLLNCQHYQKNSMMHKPKARKSSINKTTAMSKGKSQSPYTKPKSNPIPFQLIYLRRNIRSLRRFPQHNVSSATRTHRLLMRTCTICHPYTAFSSLRQTSCQTQNLSLDTSQSLYSNTMNVSTAAWRKAQWTGCRHICETRATA